MRDAKQFDKGVRDGQALYFAQSADQKADKLTRKLLHAMGMEKKAGTRVKRASTLLQKWQRARRRIEKQIGEQQVREIVNRHTMGIAPEERD